MYTASIIFLMLGDGDLSVPISLKYEGFFMSGTSANNMINQFSKKKNIKSFYFSEIEIHLTIKLFSNGIDSLLHE